MAVGYVRVSTTEQRLGPDAQREQIAEWCERHGVVLAAIHQDLGVSGATPMDQREGFLAAMGTLYEQNAGILVVAKLDRLARAVALVEHVIGNLLSPRGARLVSAAGEGTETTDPSSTLLRQIVSAHGEFERQTIRIRTRAALDVKRRRGERVGSIPYGLRLADDGVHLEPHPEEQAVIARVRGLRRRKVSMRAIVARFNAEGVPARGARWHLRTITRICARFAK